MKLSQNSFWRLKTRNSGIFLNSEVLLVEFRGGSRTAATSKMERFVLMSHCFKVKPEENIFVYMT